MTPNFYFTATSWFPGNVRVKPHSKHSVLGLPEHPRNLEVQKRREARFLLCWFRSLAITTNTPGFKKLSTALIGSKSMHVKTEIGILFKRHIETTFLCLAMFVRSFTTTVSNCLQSSSFVCKNKDAYKDAFHCCIPKVHIFWEGHKILRNLHRKFDRYYIGQIYGGDFAKFCGLLRIY